MNEVMKKQSGNIALARANLARLYDTGVKTGGADRPFLSYRNKEGRYLLGRDQDEIPLGTEAIVHPAFLKAGFCDFSTTSGVGEKRLIGLMSESQFENPQLAPFGQDGWKNYAEGLFAIQEGEVWITAQFSALNISNRNAVGALMEQIAERMETGAEDLFPRILLKDRTYTNSYGQQKAPTFEVVGWSDAEHMEGLQKPANEPEEDLMATV